MRKIRISLTIGLTSILLLGVVGVQASYGEEDPPAFPESHKDFLGGASYMALFGKMIDPADPGPGSSGGGKGGKPSVGPNVQVNDPQLPFPDGLLGRSETTIAASKNSQHIVVGWNDADGFCGPPFGAPCTPPPTPGLSGYGFSSDAGGTFIDGGAPFVFGSPGVMTVGDPSMDVSGKRKGETTFYYANLGVFISGPFAAFPTAGVTVHRGSFDDAGNFAWTDAALLQSPNFPNDFLDKEHIAADKRKDSEGVYVSVTNFIETCDGLPFFGFGQIEGYSSSDGGATWSQSIIQPDETFDCTRTIGPDLTGDGVINQGSQPAVGPDGSVYVAWERGILSPLFGAPVTPEIRVARSTDNGATWTPAAALPLGSGVNPAGVLVSKICSGAFFPPSGYNRDVTNDFPRVDVIPAGDFAGRVVVVWQDCRTANGGTQETTGGFGNPDTDIYVSSSDDSGASWSAPLLVAGGGDGKIQFWPTVSVLPNGEHVDITYYESEELGGTSLVDLFWVQSGDGGATFGSPVRISEVTTDWGATATNIIPNFGDYNTAVSRKDRIFATWADGRNGVPDTFFAVGH